ncbi:hypothetical protein S-CBP4_0001 [Synechococcus phage S-CBP4]|uniref:Uncharacterized protein n=1 Tax=Synechococcus phage S-CBP4 TaxID=754059 RepID=A0A096VKM2_9CAUD|nr:hypothetical protein S-CBP4_0001 [Synechococcus phage S-CBP4]AGK86610.1 hypothetical protein S-CBP4_0001 [Synechococcus phage S-CBP4]
MNIALLSIASTSVECMKCHDHTCIPPVARRCIHTLPHLAVTDPCCLSRPSGYSANGVLIRLSRFDALTIAWLERFVKEWWSACQVAQCQGCLPYSVVGCLSSLLVEVSRLSSPLTGRVEILSTSKKSMGRA